MTKWIGKSIGNIVCVQQSGNLRFAAKAIKAFGNIENKIPSISCNKPASQRFYVANSISLKTVIYDHLFNRFDCIKKIEFRRFFEIISFFQIFITQVVSYANF